MTPELYWAGTAIFGVIWLIETFDAVTAWSNLRLYGRARAARRALLYIVGLPIVPFLWFLVVPTVLLYVVGRLVVALGMDALS